MMLFALALLAAADIPAIIAALGTLVTALTGFAVVFFTYLTRKQVQTMAPQVSAIDRAVNGQPAGTEHLVDKVSGIKIEQERVADELAYKNRTWADVERDIREP
jgi:hypothetical protein